VAKKKKNGKKKKPPVARERAQAPRRPRQQPLPGTEDRAIRPIEEAAARYADIRDQRMALNQDEAALKQSLIRLMKRNGKTHYKRDGIEIDLISEAESIRVRVRKPGDEDADMPLGAAGEEPEPDGEGEGEGAGAE